MSRASIRGIVAILFVAAWGALSTGCPKEEYAFRVAGPTGKTVATFDDKGNVQTRGAIATGLAEGSPGLTRSADSIEFLVMDSSGAIVARLDGNTGNLYLKGQLERDPALTLTPAPEFAVCDGDGTPQVVIDAQGNLKYRGRAGLVLVREVSRNAYSPCGLLDVTLRFYYYDEAPITAIGLTERLPGGWSYDAWLGPGDAPEIMPPVGANTLEFAGLSIPDFPFTFGYRVRIPADAEGNQSISGSALYRTDGTELESLTVQTLLTAGSSPEGECGEGEGEGSPEGGSEGEGEGEGEGETAPPCSGASCTAWMGSGVTIHAADQNADSVISLSELLRVIQFLNNGAYHCDSGAEDGFAAGPGDTAACTPHDGDYDPQDWAFSLGELLRLTQFYYLGEYRACPVAEPPTEDGFYPGRQASITLAGNPVSTSVACGAEWQEPGYSAIDTCTGEVLPETCVCISGEVDTSKIGTYLLIYRVYDAQGGVAASATRTVTVGAETPAPSITLLGPETMQLLKGAASWDDPWASAVDGCGADLAKGNIHRDDSAVEYDVPGTYAVTYTAADGLNRQSSPATRTVEVVAKPNILFVAMDDLNDWVGYLSRKPGEGLSGVTSDDDPTGGHPDAYTPHLDGLANSGRAFRHAYCPAPLCIPSRTAVMTGRHPATTGIYQQGRWHRDPEMEANVLPKALNQNGYRTFGIGKIFHDQADFAEQGLNVDSPTADSKWAEDRKAIEDAFGGAKNFSYPDAKRGDEKHSDTEVVDIRAITRNHPHMVWGKVDVPWPDTTIVEEGVAKIRYYGDELAQGDAPFLPFFLAVGIFRPHVPLNVPESHFELFRQTLPGTGFAVHLPRPFCYFTNFTPAGPHNYDDGVLPWVANGGYGVSAMAWPWNGQGAPYADLAIDGASGMPLLDDSSAYPVRYGHYSDLPERAKWLLHDENLTWPIQGEGHWYSFVHAYLASVAYADAKLGELLTQLEAEGLKESTAIVVWGDNGLNLGEQGHVAKGALWERTTRVPLIIRVPGMPDPGYQAEAPVSLLDLYPTLYRLCVGKDAGAKLGLDGESLRDILNNPDASRGDARPVLTSFRSPNAREQATAWEPIHGVRGSVGGTQYRYIRYTEDGTQAELYNLSMDPWEARNLIADGVSAGEQAVIDVLSAAIPADCADPVYPIDNQTESVCPLSQGQMASFAYGCGGYIYGTGSDRELHFPPDEYPYDGGEGLGVTLGVGRVWSAAEDTDVSCGTVDGPFLAVPIQVYNGHFVKKVDITLEWNSDTDLGLSPKTGDTCSRTAWSVTAESTSCGPMSCERALTVEAQNQSTDSLNVGTATVVVMFFNMDTPPAPGWEGISNTSFNLSGTYYDSAGSGTCSVLTQDNCMNYTPVAPERGFAYAVHEPNLHNVIARHDAMEHGAFGWPCEAHAIEELDASNAGISETNVTRGDALDGMRELVNLKVLRLDGNPGIQKLRKLNRLPLTHVYLSGCTNLISSAVPLSQLHCLEELDLSGCLGTDASPFTTLNATLYDTLGDTYLYRVKKLWLAGCTNLTTSGIGVLKCLPALEYIDLSGCTGIESLDCLVENADFGSGDTLRIYLDDWSNALQDDIRCLRAHGVMMDTNCPDNSSSCADHVSDCSTACEASADFCSN